MKKCTFALIVLLVSVISCTPTPAPTPSTTVALATSTAVPTHTPIPTGTLTSISAEPTPGQTAIATVPPTAEPVRLICEQSTTLSYSIEQIKQWARRLPYEQLSAPINVPEALQAQFRTINTDRRILYVGKKNRGGEMNAVLTSRAIMGRTLADGFGERDNPSTKQLSIIIGEFEGIVPAGDGTTDFYAILKDPRREERMVVRVDLNPAHKFYNTKPEFYTQAQVENYGVPVADAEIFRGPQFRIGELFRKGIPFEKFMAPGDFIYCYPALDSTGHLKPRDSNGIIVAQGIAVTRFDGYQAVRDLFD